MDGLQRFKAMKEFTAGHRLCCLYRQSHYVGLFQFAKDCLNGTLVPSLSKPSDRLSPTPIQGGMGRDQASYGGSAKISEWQEMGASEIAPSPSTSKRRRCTKCRLRIA
jgi:hypothetical protein